jgi:hypothetical protein
MKAYIQGIEKNTLQEIESNEKLLTWYAHIPNLIITNGQISFSFRWKEWNYQVTTKSKDNYYYSGKVQRSGYDDEELDFNYYLNNKHHLFIGNWHELNLSFLFVIEAHEL